MRAETSDRYRSRRCEAGRACGHPLHQIDLARTLCPVLPKPLLATTALLIALGYAVMPAVAGALDVDVELVLAVDVSGSMDVDEQDLQRQGYARALRDQDVVRAIAKGAYGRVALTYVEWGDPGSDRVIVPWTIVSTPSDAVGFADRIVASPPTRPGLTSISSALLFAEQLLHESGVRSLRQIIDVSGDGPNNFGPAVDVTRDRLVHAGIAINGLAITVKGGEGFSWGPGSSPDILLNYYEDCVIGGPGSFLIAVDDPARFEIAIRQKLILEISGLPARVLPAAEVARTALTDCQIGEKHLYPPNAGHP